MIIALIPEGVAMGIKTVNFALGALQEGIKRHGCLLQPGDRKLLRSTPASKG